MDYSITCRSEFKTNLKKLANRKILHLGFLFFFFLVFGGGKLTKVKR